MLASSSTSSSASVTLLDDNTESITTVLSDCIDSESGDSIKELFELLPLEKANSSIWKHFGFPAQDSKFKEKDKKKQTTVYCKLCPRKLHHQGSTTNMMVHLEYSHRAEFLKIKVTQRSASTNGKTKDPDQPMIGDSFEKTQPLSQRWKTLTTSVCHYIAKDMMPFSTVSNVGFQKMLRTFEP